MKTSAKELARALYLATREADAKELPALIRSFVAVTKQRGLTAFLPNVLTALPAAMEEVDARTRVTVTSATPVDDATLAKALKAAGIDPQGREIVRTVSKEAIGGIRIRTSDTDIDATVEKYVSDLKQSFVGKSN